MYDLLIIGSGPAGVSAALSAKARGLDFLWFGSRQLSPKIAKAERVMNYPGLPAVTGPEMREAFLHQVDSLGISVLEERVNSIYGMGGYYTAVVNDKMYDGRTVILAPGVSNSREIPGESRLLGKGVSYCATCDGELYRGKRIAVVCTDPSLEEEVEFLAGLASDVFLCTSYKDCGVQRDNVRHTVGYPAEILGEDRASGLICGGETVAADGVFCLRSCVAPSALLPGLAAEGGHIRVDRGQRTNLPGCFAAGDCTGRPYSLLTVLNAVIAMFSNLCGEYGIQKVTLRARMLLWKKILHLPIREVERRQPSSLISGVVNDITQASAVIHMIFSTVASVYGFIRCCVEMARFNAKPSAYMLLLVPLAIGVFALVGQLQYRMMLRRY